MPPSGNEPVRKPWTSGHRVYLVSEAGRLCDVLASTAPLKCLQSGIFCGSWNDPHITRSFRGQRAVIGLRNCKTASRRSRSSSSNLIHNDQGSVSSHNTGINRARMAFQKELRTKLSSHHWRQRFKVLGLIFNTSRMRRTRSGFTPCIIAEINTTIRPA